MFPPLLVRRRGTTLLTETRAEETTEWTGLRREVAAEDAACIVVMMQLGAEDAMGAEESHITFCGEQHPEKRRREVYPEIGPEMRGERGGEAARRIHAHTGERGLY